MSDGGMPAHILYAAGEKKLIVPLCGRWAMGQNLNEIDITYFLFCVNSQFCVVII